jgi:hypothetical protein
VVSGLFDGFADDRHTETPTDDVRDVPERNAFLRHAVISRGWGVALERQPEQRGRVETMYRGPVVEPIALVLI